MTSDKQCHQALAAREKPKSNVCQCNNVDKKAIKTIIDLERMKTDRKTVEGRAIAPKQGMLNVENQLTAYKQSDQVQRTHFTTQEHYICITATEISVVRKP